MKSKNIVKRLKKQGYEVDFDTWEYWDNVPIVKGTAIAEIVVIKKYWCTGINFDLRFRDVLEAIEGNYYSVGSYLKGGREYS